MTLRLTLLLLLLAGCGATRESLTIEQRMSERGYLIGPAQQTIPRYRVNGWSSVDDDYLIVNVGVRGHYLVELAGPCLNLDYAFSIGFTTPTSRLDRFGSVLVRSQGPGVERCRIREIYALVDLD